MGYLPQELIERILSFFSKKAAARSCAVSKLCFKCWVMRGQVDFDLTHFKLSDGGGYAIEKFNSYMHKTIERFALGTSRQQRMKEILIKATDSVVESLLHLLHEGKWEFDSLLIEIVNPVSRWKEETYCIPEEILDSKNLKKLYIVDCGVHAVNLEAVQDLRLSRVFVDGNDISDFIYCSASIQILHIIACKFFNAPNLFPQPLVNSAVEGQKVFTNLQTLWLERIRIKRSFFVKFQLKFPILKKLTLRHNTGPSQQRLILKSSTLEDISIVHKFDLDAKFVVPMIRCFRYTGGVLPRLTFEDVGKRIWRAEFHLTTISPRWRLDRLYAQCYSIYIVKSDRYGGPMTWFF